MRKVLICLLCTLLINGCKVIKKSTQTISVPSTSYHMANTSFYISDTNAYDEGKTVFQIKNELELAQLLQFRYERQEEITSYICEKELNLDLVSEYLSHVNPFDIRLVQTLNEYRDRSQKIVYRSYDIQLEHLDPFYEDSLAFAETILDEIIDDTMSKNEKIKAVHDYLIMHVIYDDMTALTRDQSTNAFRAYGALFEHSAVCTGYARAFMIMMQLLEIPAIYVSSDVIDHSWNMVYSDTGWRYLDVTWDDHDNSQLDTTYFLKTEQEFYADGKHSSDGKRDAKYDLFLAENFFPMQDKI